MTTTFTRGTTISPAATLDQEAEQGPTTLEEALILNRLTATAWQVCDSRHLPHGPGYLLGFVERVGDGVELMQLGEKFIWTGFDTMTAALTHVAATAYTTATERAAGDLAWIG